MSKDRARRLRRDATEAEKALWRGLRARTFAGLKFRRQHPVGPYIVDFVCLDHHLVIEVDGGHHALDPPRRTHDIETQGFIVLRFWNNQVLDNLDGVLADIAHVLSRT